MNAIGKHGIIKFDLQFGPVLHNFSIDIGSLQSILRKEKSIFEFIGFDNEFDETIKRSLNIFNQQVSIEYHSDETHLVEQSVTLLEPGEDLIVYLSNEWIHIENKQRQEQKLTIHLNETNFFSNENNFQTNHHHLVLGFNRNVNGNQTGIGLCRVNLTFIECLADPRMFEEKGCIILINNFYS